MEGPRPDKFTYNSVQKLLTNKRYIGENHFKDIVMPDSIPAIVDKELFDRVQAKIEKNRRAPAHHKAEDDYLLTTKLFCGMCGAMMFGECGTSRNIPALWTAVGIRAGQWEGDL